MWCANTKVRNEFPSELPWKVEVKDLPGKVGAIAVKDRIPKLVSGSLDSFDDFVIFLCGGVNSYDVRAAVVQSTDVLTTVINGDGRIEIR
jgi:hypothetical protein